MDAPSVIHEKRLSKQINVFLMIGGVCVYIHVQIPSSDKCGVFKRRGIRLVQTFAT